MIGPLVLALIALHPQALAATGQLTIRIAIDDRVVHRLVAPVLETTGGPAALFADNGVYTGDMAGDLIYFAQVSIPAPAVPADHVTVHIRDNSVDFGEFDVPLKPDGRGDLALKTRTGQPAIVVDSAAPPMPASTSVSATPVAAIEGAGPTAADKIILNMQVDDRTANRLHTAHLLVDQAGAVAAPLRDDGVAPDEQANDGIYVCQLTVSRTQTVVVNVFDEPDGVIGTQSIFLPSSSEATVHLQTLSVAPGIALAKEPEGGGGASSPTGGGGTTETGSGGGDRVSQILWVFIALFAVGFTWARTVVGQRWATEVKPVLARLERWLDLQEVAARRRRVESGHGAGHSEGGPEGGAPP